MGFDVVESEEFTGQTSDLRSRLHWTLDRILDGMARKEQDGGAASLEIPCSKGHTHVLRLTVSDFTDEQLCTHCSGTGAEPSDEAKERDKALEATEVGE